MTHCPGCCFEKIFALQAEALLKLHKHQDADETMSKGPNFELDSCTKFLGPIGSANLLAIRAQVDLAAGRLVCSIWLIKIISLVSSVTHTDFKANVLAKHENVPFSFLASNPHLRNSEFNHYSNGLLLIDHDFCLSNLSMPS